MRLMKQLHHHWNLHCAGGVKGLIAIQRPAQTPIQSLQHDTNVRTTVRDALLNRFRDA
jgi:hypothetical protein